MPAGLDPDEARKLIVSRMSDVRSGEKLIPFTEDFVDYVFELTQGLPRKILEICATVLNEAANRGLKKIRKADARKILKDLLISYEPIAASP
jgi:type II secretory pathway predicted ATPase ExeA